MDKEKEQKSEISLRDFIKERGDLISTLGIFAGLTLFSHNFISGKIGEGISFLFLSGFVLLFLELWSTFPKQRGTTRLAFFEDALVFTGFGIIAYWFVRLWFLSIDYFIVVISLLVSIFIVNFLMTILKKMGIMDRLFNQVKSEDPKRYLFGTIVIVLIFFIVLLSINKISEKIIKDRESSLNTFFQELIKK
jgi:hypothetical protein